MEQKITKTLSLVCPSCGGRMELSTDGEKAVCPYCGHEMLIDIAGMKCSSIRMTPRSRNMSGE